MSPEMRSAKLKCQIVASLGNMLASFGAGKRLQRHMFLEGACASLPRPHSNRLWHYFGIQ